MADSGIPRFMEQAIGPLTARQLRQQADEGILKSHMLVRKGESGQWMQARHVKGLITSGAMPPSPPAAVPPAELIRGQLVPVGETAALPQTATKLDTDEDKPTDFIAAAPRSSGQTPTTKACPFCGEEILAVAKKCKHCGEFFDHQASNSQSARPQHTEVKGRQEEKVLTELTGKKYKLCS